MPTSSVADTFNVTTTVDTCAPPSAVNLCSPIGPGQWDCDELRHAFNDINLGTGTGPHTVLLPGGTILYDTTTAPVPADNDNTCGDMDLAYPVDVTITGHPSGSSTLDAEGGPTGDRALDFHDGSVRLENFTITDGFARPGKPGDPVFPNFGGGAVRTAVVMTMVDMDIILNRAESILTFDPGGGGVYSSAQLEVFNSDFTENLMIEGSGGAIHAEGGLSIDESTVRSNRASNGGWGGGIALSGGPGSSILRTTITANNASEMGGGVVVFGAGTSVDIVESVIDNNLVNWFAPTCTTCQAGGGGIAAHQGSVVNLLNSTVSTNTVNPDVDSASPQPDGGAIWVTNPGATLVMDYATVSNNVMFMHGSTTATDSGIQCDGTCTVNDSIAEDICTTTGTMTWGVTAIDAAGGTCSGGPFIPPFLGALSLSGGSPTRTHPHTPGSPADNAANPATCPAIDQRGVARNPACDIGAHEVP